MGRLSKNAKNAIMLGLLCSVAYYAVYIARNVLSAVTPQMVAGGGYTEEYIGSVSSLYFIFYALGQLINGMIGDRIKAKYMISFGLLFAGITNVTFVYLIDHPFGATVAYAMTGFFLSMIYAPMTKVVSENTEPIHATRCSLGYTFSSFFGSPTAGFLAAFLTWQSVFAVSSIALVTMAIVCFLFFALMERKKIICYGSFDQKTESVKKSRGGVKLLLENQIVKFSLVAILTGIVRTSVLFWLPTYYAQFLGYSPQQAASIFTVSTLIISMTTFLAVFTYERLHRNMDATVLLMFILAALFFGLSFLVRLPLLNIVFIVLAILTADGASSVLWCIYCPGLKKTGMVSSATGFLDFLSYSAAAIANLLFANSVSVIGWGGLILVWFALMVVGVLVSLPYKRKKKEERPS